MSSRASDVSRADFKRRYGPWAVVAGASEGIGRAFCRKLALQGLDLVLVARREEPLRSLARELEQTHRVQTRTLALDLGAEGAIARLAGATEALDVGLLVYNAAFAAIGPFLEQPLADKLAILDVNCRGVVAASSHFGTRLAARGRGGMLLMSSMSGWQGAPRLAVYAASKAFITTLGEALWYELRPHGVDVHVCVAGATKTPGFLAQTPADQVGSTFAMSPEAVADAALANLGDGPVVIPGVVNRLAYGTLSKLLPRRLAIRFFGRTAERLYGGGGRAESGAA